jgi:hypothetical protein
MRQNTQTLAERVRVLVVMWKATVRREALSRTTTFAERYGEAVRREQDERAETCGGA